MRARRFVLPVLVLAMTTTPAALVISAAPAAAATVATAGFAPPLPLMDASGASTGGSEPSIAVDSHDNIYVSAPASVPSGGCPFWNVHKDGQSYDYRGTMDTDQGSVGGGDCDISTLSTPAAAYDDVSVTSLSLANLTSNVTKDGGETWETVANSASQQVFGVDRQWQAADAGLGRHYLTVHDLATSNIQTSVSIDGGYQYVQNTPAIRTDENPSAHGTPVYFKGTTPGGNHFGPTVVNPVTHKLYIPFLAAAPPETGGTEHAVWIAEGDPCAAPQACVPGAPAAPIVWNNYLAFNAPAGLSLANDFPAITIDPSGVVYLGFTGDIKKPASATATLPSKVDTNRIFVTHSKPGDVTTGAWSAPQAVDPGTANANVFPWLVSGSAGNVGIAWYTSTLAASTTCPGAGTTTNNPVSDNCRNLWNVAYAQSSNANAAAPEWVVSDVSGLVHKGPICNVGLNCAAGTRTMLDFFDVAMDSHGRPNIAYVSDTRSLDTADVQFTRQCTGVSLTGEALGTCTGGGAPTVCPADAAYTDAAGDATNVLGNQTPAPSDDAFDIVGGSFATTADDVVLTVKLKDLTNAPDGQIVEQHFMIAGKEYYVMATRPTGGGAVTYVYGDMTTGTVPGRRKLGDTTGTFDDAKDVVTTAFPRAATSPALADGTAISGLAVTTRRDGQAAIPDVDTAAGPCAYAVGAVNADPVVPEVPYSALLPTIGVALFGFLYYRRRNGTRTA